MNLFTDQMVGFWIKNVPYKLDPLYSISKKRIYDISNVKTELPDITDSPCKDLVEFKDSFIEDGKNLYINGRTHYWFQPIPPTVSTIQLSPTRIKSSISWKPIFEILCGTVKGELPCTDLGVNISSSLIKVASTRIFNNPEQCIVEMIVNSVDSYGSIKGIPKVGRFGMGFFSILYFLINHPLRSLSILTINEDKKAVCVTIRYETTLLYKISVIETESATGTVVFLDASNDLFNQNEVELFHKFYRYTRLIESSTIYDSERKIMITSTNTDFPVAVDCRSTHLFVEDFATGMSLKTILQSLLIPSVSTKTITLSTQPTLYENYSTIERDENSTLSIVVNRVCIVMIPIKVKTPTTTPLGYSVIISLPSNVTLPVTRDDVIFSGKTKDAITDSLIILLKKCISLGTLLPLEYAIDTYIGYTSNGDNKIVFSKFREKMYDTLFKKKYILIDHMYECIFSKIIPNILISERMNSLTIEKKLDSLATLIFSTNIFKYKRVVFLDKIGKTTTANTYKYIFIDEEEKTKDNWQENLLLTFREQRLYPALSAIDSNESVLLEKCIEKILNKSRFFVGLNLPKERIDMIRTLCTVVLSIQYQFKIHPKDKQEVIERIIYNALYVNELDPLFFNTFIDIYIKYFSGLEFNYDYGNCMHKFWCWGLDDTKDEYGYYFDLFTYLRKHKNNDNYIKHIKELILLNIELFSDKTYHNYNRLHFYLFVYEFTDFYKHPSFNKLNDDKSSPNLNKFIKYFEKLDIYLGSSLSIYEILLLQKICYEMAKTKDYSKEYLLENIPMIIKRCNYIYEKYIKKVEGYKLVDITYWDKKIMLQYACQNFVLFTDDSLELSSKTLPTFSGGVSYTFKQLLHYVFKNDQINLLDKKISKLPKQTSLQILEIAVDASTSKPFLTSTLTELIQNSMDAIRLSHIAQRDVEITIGKVTGTKSLFITIKDHVGMTLSNLTALSIPFYSDKIASEIVTGEMGTGFFNIYRESSLVLIDTVRDGNRINIIDTPIREDGRIVDISKQIISSKEKGKDKGSTSITFVLPYVESTISDAYYYIQHVLSYMNFDHLYLNGIHVKLEKTKVYEKGSLTCYITEEPNLSFLFTKGVPFYPLVEYLNSIELNIPENIYEILSCYVIIDMGHEFYKPVQSRTKIQQTPENLILLQHFLYQSIFKVVIRRLYYCIIGKNNEDKSLYLQNIDFPDDSRQVVFTETKKKDEWKSLQDVILYTPLLNEMGEEIKNHEGQQQTLAKMFKRFCYLAKNYKEIIGTKDDEADLLSFDMYLKTVYLAWVTTKNQPQEKQTKSDDKDVKVDDKTLFIFTKFINLYDEKVRNVIIEKMNGNMLAFYKPSTHSIHINKDMIDVAGVDYFLKHIDSYLVNITNIRDDSFYNMWFALLNPATTIPHELEHARRNSSHDSDGGTVGPHDNIIYKGKEMSFDDVANKVLQEKMNNSLVVNWLSEIKKYCKL
jgi:hypothetical protein